MSTFQEHCNECEAVLGKSFDFVHRWLDEFASSYFPSPIHRAIRHHAEGIEEVRKLWGDEAAEAARLHIQADMSFMPSKSWWENETEVICDPIKGVYQKSLIDLLTSKHRNLFNG